jgi:hypothetical protein
MFAMLTVFLWVAGAIYWLLSREPAGTTALVLCGGLTFLVGFYVLFTGRRVDLRPEDDPQGEIDDAHPEYGFYAPHSWWPLPTAGSAAVVALGFVFGWWLAIIGVALLFFSAVGFVFEYYRGDHAH